MPTISAAPAIAGRAIDLLGKDQYQTAKKDDRRQNGGDHVHSTLPGRKDGNTHVCAGAIPVNFPSFEITSISTRLLDIKASRNNPQSLQR
jgi:hypothetical protein